MKKLLFMFTLSLLSFRAYGADSPDGSEPEEGKVNVRALADKFKNPQQTSSSGGSGFPVPGRLRIPAEIASIPMMMPASKSRTSSITSTPRLSSITSSQVPLPSGSEPLTSRSDRPASARASTSGIISAHASAVVSELESELQKRAQGSDSSIGSPLPRRSPPLAPTRVRSESSPLSPRASILAPQLSPLKPAQSSSFLPDDEQGQKRTSSDEEVFQMDLESPEPPHSEQKDPKEKRSVKKDIDREDEKGGSTSRITRSDKPSLSVTYLREEYDVSPLEDIAPILLSDFDVVLPNFAQLIDLDQSYGLNIGKAIERFEKFKDLGLMGLSEVSVNILNLQTFKFRLTEATLLETKVIPLLKKLIHDLKNPKDTTQISLKDRPSILSISVPYFGDVAPKSLNDKLREAKDKLKKGGTHNESSVGKNIKEATTQILKVLSPFGLTLEHLKQLPGRNPSTNVEKAELSTQISDEEVSGEDNPRSGSQSDSPTIEKSDESQEETETARRLSSLPLSLQQGSEEKPETLSGAPAAQSPSAALSLTSPRLSLYHIGQIRESIRQLTKKIETSHGRPITREEALNEIKKVMRVRDEEASEFLDQYLSSNPGFSKESESEVSKHD